MNIGNAHMSMSTRINMEKHYGETLWRNSREKQYGESINIKGKTPLKSIVFNG